MHPGIKGHGKKQSISQQAALCHDGTNAPTQLVRTNTREFATRLGWSFGMPATAHLTAALACSHFAASLLVLSLIEATGVLCSLLTALTALCSAPVMLLAWLRACVSLLVLLQLAWLRHACSLAGGIAAIVQLRHPADCQSAFPC